MIRFLSLLVSIPVIILIAAFTYKNAQLVTIDLFKYQIDLPLAVVLLIALILGVFTGFMLNIVVLIKQKNKYRQLKNKTETLQGLTGVLDKTNK